LEERVDGRERKKWYCWWEKEKKAPDKDRGGTEKEEGGLEFPKDLYAISENHRDLSVKQNFPLI
jgi:hypothetical protein